jgi:GNAT superfamily N-acetyltransferase
MSKIKTQPATVPFIRAMRMQNSLLKPAATTAQYLWAEYPMRSGNILCDRKDLLHTEWFQEMGLPSWGNAFDRIACGIIKVDKANKTAVIQTYHPDFAPREVWQYFRKKLPAEFSLDEEKYNPDQDKRFEKKYSSENYPPELNGLAAEARKCSTFKEFKNDFSSEIKHGVYYHLTDNPNFTIDLNTGPRDMSSMADGQAAKGKLMITSHLDNWDAYYNWKDEDTEEVTRPYVAIIDMSQVPRNAYHQVGRGFGNEFWVEDPSKAKVTKVVPVAEARAYDTHQHDVLSQHINSNEDLEQFYNWTKGIKTAKPSDIAKVQPILQEFMHFLAPGLPLPHIQVVDNLKARWLGRCKWDPLMDDTTTTIELQRSILNDDKTLRRVIAHELCHHDWYLTYWRKLHPRDQRTLKFRDRDIGHGDEWKKRTDAFNAAFGAGFVTPKSDETYVLEENTKEFYVLIMDYYGNGNMWAYAISARLSPKQRQKVDECVAGGRGKLFLTTDKDFIGAAEINKGWSRATGTNLEKVLKLWREGTPAVLPEFKAPTPPDPNREFYVCLRDAHNLRYFAWSQTISPRQKALLEKTMNDPWKVVKCNDKDFKTKKIGDAWDSAFLRWGDMAQRWQKLWDTAPVVMSGNLGKSQDWEHGQAKGASPDFGYSEYNNREKDLKKVRFVSQGLEDRGFGEGELGVAAKYGNEDIGHIDCSVVSRLCTVYSVTINDDWRGTGLGQMLYDAAIQVAKKAGCRIFSSDTTLSGDAVNAWNRLKNRYPVDELDNPDYDDDTEENDGDLYPTYYRIDLNRAPVKPLNIKKAAIAPADRTLYHGTNDEREFDTLKPTGGDPVVWLGELDTARDIYSRQIRGGRNRVFEVKLKPDAKIADLLDESQPCTEKVRSYFLRVVGYKVLDHAWSDVMNYVAFHNHDHVLISMLKEMGFDGAIVMDKGRPPGGPSRTHHSVALWNMDAIESQQEMKAAHWRSPLLNMGVSIG